jgi:hypothetical protein
MLIEQKDQKLVDLARIGYRSPNGSKFFSQRRNAPDTTPSKAEIKARRKAERDRKRDQRRKARR